MKNKEKIVVSDEADVKTTPKTAEKMAEKTPQKVEFEMPKKSIEKEEENTPNVNSEDLVSILKIPMQEAHSQEREKSEPVFSDNTEPQFNRQESQEPVFESESEEINENEDDYSEEENLNDKYLSSDEPDDDFDEFFDDEKLMSEMGVEVIDMLMTYGCMFIAKDWGEQEKYAVSDYHKKKIRKPLEKIIVRNKVKVNPNIMFIITLLIIYAPMILLAVNTRKEKAKSQQPTANSQDIANDIPPHIPEVNHNEIIRQRQENTPTPMVVPEKPKNKGGRPKGSKDKKPRKKKK